mgnify:CR=1 FL=1
MKKITVIGFTNSGKTTYLMGTYCFMSMGGKSGGGYALVTDEENGNLLHNLWNQLQNYGQWPAASDVAFTCTFSLQRYLKSIDGSEFEWIDYPGSTLMALSPEVRASINEASCLVLIVDGESFAFTRDKEKSRRPIAAQNDAQYKSVVGDNLLNNGDKLAIMRLGQMVAGGISLPPVAVVVTKRDLIPPERLKYIPEIIPQEFDTLFYNGVPVFLTSVTLGAEIERNGTLSPEDVEKPLFYALLSTFCQEIDAIKKRIADNKKQLEAQDTMFNRLFHQDMLDELKRRIYLDEDKIRVMSENASPMLDFFGHDSVFYVNGEQAELREYFSGRLSL